jgi:Flp pilus assembly protein TadG
MPRPMQRRKGRGQALLEFALVAPIMLTFLGASLDLARVFQAWITLQSSTRDAAEYAASAAIDAATAQSGARRIVCTETQYLSGFQAGATVAECANPTVAVTAWSRSGTAPGATADTPLASVTVTASIGFSMLFPYPFLANGTWTLSASQSYAIIQGR